MKTNVNRFIVSLLTICMMVFTMIPCFNVDSVYAEENQFRVERNATLDNCVSEVEYILQNNGMFQVNVTADTQIYNRFYENDYIIDKTNNIQMCDIDVRRVSGSGKNRHTTYLFQGMFCFSELANNNFNYNIKIFTFGKRFF